MPRPSPLSADALRPPPFQPQQQRRLQQLLWVLLAVFGLLVLMNLSSGRMRSAGLEGLGVISQ